MMYAIHVTDLMEYRGIDGLSWLLMRPKLCTQNACTVEVDRSQVDGRALICDAHTEPAQFWATLSWLCDKFHERIGRPLRIYERGPRGGWKRIPEDRIHTEYKRLAG